MSRSKLEFDDGGYPILLAVKAPGQVAAQNVSGASVVRGARSGNPNADTGSGRFASGSKQKQPGSSVVDVNPVTVNRLGLPQGVTPEEWERRLDAIRDAAREYDDMAEGDAKDFLKGRVQDLSAVDLASFLADVRGQRIDDLIDVLDYQLRSQVVGNDRARRFVRLQAPRGFTKKLFASLSDDEVINVVTRLSNRGWSADDLVEQVIKKVNKEDRRKQLEERFRASAGSVKLADWNGHFRPVFEDVDDLEFMDEEQVQRQQELHIQMPELPQAPSAIELADALGKVAESMPQPVINVTVEAPKGRNKVVKRGADGLITGVEDVDD